MYFEVALQEMRNNRKMSRREWNEMDKEVFLCDELDADIERYFILREGDRYSVWLPNTIDLLDGDWEVSE